MKSTDQWMSISDMMSGLMLIFMFIAISFMIQVQEDKDKMKEIAITYSKDKRELNHDLKKEFSHNLEQWEAEITDDNVFIFNSPHVLFNIGEDTIRNKFGTILNDFFPRYINVLTSKKYINEIDEIRVEGHTSKTWGTSSSPKETYLNNMSLSQNRANNVLAYCYSINNPMIKNNKKWFEKTFRANGMAFAKMRETAIKSRRVEFKIKMKTEEKIYKILQVSQ